MALPDSPNQLSPGLVLTILAFLSAIVTGILYVIRSNKLLFNCLLIATVFHVAIVGAFWFVGNVTKAHELIKINVNFMPPEPVKPEELEKKPEEFETNLYKEFGDAKSKEDASKIAKGDPNKEYKPGSTASGGNAPNPLTNGEDRDGNGIPDSMENKEVGMPTGAGINTGDIPGLGSGEGQKGLPGGTDGGGVPKGFNDGKKDGKLYFMRVKHSEGSWNSNSEGISNLLKFMNMVDLSAANRDTPMDLKSIDSQYLSKGGVPSFLYFYCDVNFSLTANEVDILKKYIDKGGFLFLDSRSDDSIEKIVKAQMSKVFPSNPMTKIPRSHAINTYQFKISDPGVGLNLVSNATNYGIQKGNRYVVFYTRGNFAQLYKQHESSSSEYFKAQYQMGANVILYAIKKGQAGAVEKRAGASAKIDASTINIITGAISGGTSIASPKPTDEPPPLKAKPVEEKPVEEIGDDELPDMEVSLPGLN